MYSIKFNGNLLAKFKTSVTHISGIVKAGADFENIGGGWVAQFYRHFV